MYRFPLEAFLKLRRAHEKREMVQLVTLANELTQLRHQQEELAGQRQELRRATEETLGRGTSAAELHFLVAAGASLDARGGALRERLEEAERRHRAQQEAFQQAQKGLKIVENLRTRHFAAWRREQQLREQQQIEELFLLRFPRNSR
ncbi:MAG: flagellar export protein FliJ [Terriglobia bacterium]